MKLRTGSLLAAFASVALAGTTLAQDVQRPALGEIIPVAAESCGPNGGAGCETSCCGRGGWLSGLAGCRRTDDDKAWNLFPQDNCRNIKIYGWVDAGYTTNNLNPVNPAAGNGNLPVTFNYRNEDPQLNQFYTVIERPTEFGKCGWSFGGRVDLLYGEDYILTEAAGLERRPNGEEHWNTGGGGNGIGGTGRMGLALPQAYLEAANNNLKLKVGHFYTLIGVESVMSTANFFYSHSYSHQYAQPFHHTGALASYQLSERATFHAGVVNGWDKFDAVQDRASFLGGVVLVNSEKTLGLTLMVITGDEDGSATPILGNRTMFNAIVDVKPTERIQYVFESNFGNQENGLAPGADATWYSFVNYLYYKINPCWKLGARGEWFRDEDGFRVANGFNPAGRPGEWWALALGANWTPTANIRLRPEVRWDYVNSPFAGAGLGGPFDLPDNGGRINQFLAAVDLIVTW